MAAWEDQIREISKAIRDTGNNNMIVVPGMSWGQDTGSSWNCETVTDSKSFILSHGPALMEDFDRMMFDFHIYDQWDQGFSKLDGFFTWLEELGLPTMVGEFGVDNAGRIEATRVEYMFKAAETHSFGRVAWHWFGGDNNNLTTSGNGGAWNINNHQNPTNLTWKGQRI
nr:cellulase family glycosylhydrolase [Pararhodonellum marinum]